MKAFDQNSIGFTNVLVHRAIFKREMTKSLQTYRPNWILFYQKKAEMNE